MRPLPPSAPRQNKPAAGLGAGKVAPSTAARGSRAAACGRSLANPGARQPAPSAGEGQRDASGGGSELGMSSPSTRQTEKADPSRERHAPRTPTHSTVPTDSGAQERSAMRSVGLDLGV